MSAVVSHPVRRSMGSRSDVFLLPGLFGDEPQLRDLRRRLDGRIRFQTMTLPDIEAPESLLCRLADVGEVIAREIAARQPTGAISMAGYSFGASLALEVATQLARDGRTIGYLCILDGAFKVDDLRRPRRQLLRLALTPKGALSLVVRLADKAKSWLDLHRARLFPAALARSDTVRRAFISHCRHVSLDGWDPQECRARGTLMLSRTLGRQTRLQWLGLCPHLRVVNLPSEHGDLLRGESLDLAASALADDFAAWWSETRTA